MWCGVFGFAWILLKKRALWLLSAAPLALFWGVGLYLSCGSNAKNCL